jgi:hypothetical protein
VLSEAAIEDMTRRSLEIFEAANEDPAAFQVTSRYVIATATRDGSGPSRAVGGLGEEG